MNQQDLNQPEEQIRVGGTITASIWRNETQRDNRTVAHYSVQFEKAIDEALGDYSAVDATVTSAGRACPFCGHRMRREAGCFVCDRCLHSSCG
ncbi:MAG: hypothetical protein WBE26_10685 [Phycisphaerae bacterium]